MSVRLRDLVEAMRAIAPLEYAEEWDNVGLLVEPGRARRVRRVMLTIDLTERVLEEAIEGGAQAVVAYHPPVFEALKRVTNDDWKQRLVSRALEKGVAVYSPHTALDAVEGGVNDWLAEGLGVRSSYSIKPHVLRDPMQGYKIVVFVPANRVDRLRSELSLWAGRIGAYCECSFETRGTGTFLGGEGSNPAVGARGRLERVEEVRLEMVCGGEYDLQEVEDVIRRVHPYEEPAWDVYELAGKPLRHVGQGRDVVLKRPGGLGAIARRVKEHLGLDRVRVAAAERHKRGEKIEMVSLCAGSGGSVLSGMAGDLYLTGEMRHHDVLDANQRGVSVILTDHTHSERGYLKVLRKRLAGMLKGVDVVVSKRDAEPLRIV